MLGCGLCDAVNLHQYSAHAHKRLPHVRPRIKMPALLACISERAVAGSLCICVIDVCVMDSCAELALGCGRNAALNSSSSAVARKVMYAAAQPSAREFLIGCHLKRPSCTMITR